MPRFEVWSPETKVMELWLDGRLTEMQLTPAVV